MESTNIRNSKYKDKQKAHAHSKKEGYTKPFTDSSGFKGEKEKNAHTVTKDSIWNPHACKNK
jgi:hypothetical protein